VATYEGRNRRLKKDRRSHQDRRVEIRFEPGKTDRRKGKGRRSTDNDPWDKLLNETDVSR